MEDQLCHPHLTNLYSIIVCVYYSGKSLSGAIKLGKL
jgi:hypothetical protein